jgi:hypothetical protein
MRRSPIKAGTLRAFSIAACLSCDSESRDGAGVECADFGERDGCGRASQDDLPCHWYEVQHVSDTVTCEAEVIGECLQRSMRGGSTGCGSSRAYFTEDDDGNVALAPQCGDNPPQGYASCGAEGAPEACACFVAPE